MTETLKNWFVDVGLSEPLVTYAAQATLAVGVVILAFLADWIVKRILLTGLFYVVRESRTRWDDILYKRHVFQRLAHLAPALVIYYAADFFPPAAEFIQNVAMVYMMLAGALVVSALLNGFNDIYQTYPVSHQRPIKGYLQVVKIIVFIFVGVIAISTLMDRSPWLILSGMGAMTAVLLLIFKDSILGLVASMQLSMNDMVRIGDWIEMPKYGADGDVIDITLHTVRVQNFDKTITTIPAYALISDAFKNWRGMKESGGRRIKRAINIDMQTVRFCTSEELDRYEKIQVLTDYVKTRRKEVDEFNVLNKIDTSTPINGRRLTNIGTFRAYVRGYLRNHPKINPELTFLIRQLPPGEHGLPLEIYVFSNDQVWANYEAIQADIFDHILSVVPFFDLRVYQLPSGYDVAQFATTVRGT
ncbi:MAG: mechanosensitive ion channel [candidate division Zixibacteria bacterium]|nr:mechanosensitive ion channel [candidate division Zixibacteria bacterium]